MTYIRTRFHAPTYFVAYFAVRSAWNMKDVLDKHCRGCEPYYRFWGVPISSLKSKDLFKATLVRKCY